MSSPSTTTTGPDDGSIDTKRTDVTDPDALRQELIRLAEDADADDYETAEERVTALLSDFRRAIANQKQGGGDR